MALTGTLLADFSAFTNEAAKATTAVKTMETGADTAAAKLSRIGEGVNIKSTISDPMGTATTVATQYAESLGTLGVAAVGLTAGIAALGAALFELGSHSAEVIAKFDDLADKTGMSVPALSRLSNAAAVVGADMGQLTDVVFKLERGIGENSDAFQKGLAAMGLSTAQLKAEGPDRYLEVITAGLKGIEDPSARAAAGTAVLGKGYRDVAAALNDLAAGYEKTSDIEPFTAKQAADAEAFLFQIQSLKVHVSALGVSLGSELIPVLSTYVAGIEKLLGLYGLLPDAVRTVLSPLSLLSAAFREAALAAEAFGLKATEVPPVTGTAAKGVRDWHTAVAALTPTMPTLTEAIAAQTESMKDLDPVTRRMIESTTMLAETTQGWQTTLDSIDGTVVEAIQYYLSAGVSQADLAKAYGLTAQQVKAVQIALEDYSAALNSTADFEQDAAARRKEITAAMTKDTNDQILATFKAQQAEAAYYTDTETHAKAAQQETLTTAQMQTAAQDQLNANLDKARQNFFSAASMTDDELRKLGIDLEELQGKASQAFYYAQLVPNGMSQGVEEVSGAVTAAGEAVGSSFEQGYGRAQTASSNFRNSAVADATAVAAATATWETAQGRLDAFQAAQAANPSNIRSIVGEFGGMPYVQTRDSGGPVVAGQSYLIGGGKAPEIFTPGASGFVTPGGAAGGGHVTNIYITQPLGTADAIARAVADAQVNLMRGQGVRLPYGT